MSFINRFLDWNTIDPSSTIDGFDVPIKEPKVNRDLSYEQKKHWYSYKFQGPALRYLIVTHMKSNEIIWCSKAYPGATSEIGIAETELGPLMLPEERMLGDRLFRNSDYFTTATSHSCGYTYCVDSLRSAVERRIRVLRTFEVLKQEWRGITLESHQFHRECMVVVAQLTNFYFNK